jgi:erythritol transport system ATP-binding protein
VKATGPDQAITSLSGGNQQKALIARYLLTRPKVLLLDEPSRGVDVGARGEIFQIVRRLAAEGMAVVFTSTDLHEVLSVADLILVMARGRITAELRGAERTEAALVAAASARPAGEEVARNGGR